MKSAIIQAVVLLSLAGSVVMPVNAAETARAPVVENPQVDYAAFAALTQELQQYRANRLITLDQFIALAGQNNAIILDTRSAAAFQFGHIKGAVNLPFSDFTDNKLEKLLGDKTRPILIYCNNNFTDNVFPVARKSASLALNIPTFINLYGYGYHNIYELNDVIQTVGSRVNWVSLAIDS